jgi:hypothetical protein
VFHPGLLLEGGYDSKPFTYPSDGSSSIRIIPHLQLSTLQDPKKRSRVAFDAWAASSLWLRPATKDIIQPPEGEASVALHLNLSEALSLSLTDDLLRTYRHEERRHSALYMNRAAARIDLGQSWAAGVSLGYSLDLDAFEDGRFSRYAHLFSLALLLRKPIPDLRSLWLSVSEAIISRYGDWSPNSIEPAPGPKETIGSPAMPLRVWAGALVHLPAPWLASVEAGYGNGFFARGRSYSGPLVRVELGYLLEERRGIRIGYAHDFQHSVQANYFVDDIAYTTYDHLLGRLLLHLRADYRYRRWEAMILPRHMITLRSGVDFRFRPWFYVGAAYDLELDIHRCPLMIYTCTNYTRHLFHIRLGTSY